MSAATVRFHLIGNRAQTSAFRTPSKVAQHRLAVGDARGVQKQRREKRIQFGLGPEHDVGGELGLVRGPVVADVKGRAHVHQTRAQVKRQAVEEFRPMRLELRVHQ